MVEKVAANFILLNFMADYLNSIKELNNPTERVCFKLVVARAPVVN